jgi:hypothetical protein
VNRAQRVGLFVGTAGAVVATVLHAPWTGYNTMLHDMNGWFTASPAFLWIGVLTNYLATLGGCAMLSALWFLLWRTDTESKDSRPNA